MDNKPDRETVVDYWKETLNNIFPYKPYPEQSLSTPPYMLSLQEYGALTKGTLLRHWKYDSPCSFLWITFVGAPADDVSYDWKGYETVLRGALIPLPSNMSLYAVVAIGSYVRFYEVTSDGKFGEFCPPGEKALLHVLDDEELINAVLVEIQKVWFQ